MCHFNDETESKNMDLMKMGSRLCNGVAVRWMPFKGVCLTLCPSCVTLVCCYWWFILLLLNPPAVHSFFSTLLKCFGMDTVGLGFILRLYSVLSLWNRGDHRFEKLRARAGWVFAESHRGRYVYCVWCPLQFFSVLLMEKSSIWMTLTMVHTC